MNITCKGNLVFSVQGTTGIYHVDLGENNLIGRCDCLHFRTRLQPKINRKELAGSAGHCKHIAACREYLTNKLIAALAAKEQPIKHHD